MISKERRRAFLLAMEKEMQIRLKMMRERQTYFSTIAEKYETFDEFVNAHKKWLDIVGIDLCHEDSYLSLRIQLDYQDYETYHVVKDSNGKLTVSDIIWWQELYCANGVLNISTGENADEEDIPKCYQGAQ